MTNDGLDGKKYHKLNKGQTLTLIGLKKLPGKCYVLDVCFGTSSIYNKNLLLVLLCTIL